MGKAGRLRRKGKGKDLTAVDVNQETGDAVQVEGTLKKDPKNEKNPKSDTRTSLVEAVEAAKQARRGINGVQKNDGRPFADDQGKKKFSGLIFMCNGATKQDCFKYRVLGLPQGKRDIVEQVHVGTKLFLFDIDLRLLYGVYAATSAGGFRLEPEAFSRFKRGFPAQVRFRIFRDCLPLPEDVFKVAIQENYFENKKFKCELSGKQVKKLIQLFRPVPRSRDTGLDLEQPPHVSGLYDDYPFRTGYELDAPDGRLSRDVPYIDPYDDLLHPGVPEHVLPPLPRYGVDPAASDLKLRRLEYFRDAPPDPYSNPAAGAYTQPLPRGLSEVIPEAGYVDTGLVDPALYRQRLHGYPDILNSYGGISSEPTLKRALEDIHLDERYLPLPKRSHLHQDDLGYRDLEYQRAPVAASLSYYADDRQVSRYY